jgi:hypothetical protein
MSTRTYVPGPVGSAGLAAEPSTRSELYQELNPRGAKDVNVGV